MQRARTEIEVFDNCITIIMANFAIISCLEVPNN